MSVLRLLDPAVRVAYDLVTAIAAGLPVPPGVAVLVGVAALTVFVRAALLPLALRGVRADQARRSVAPQIAELRTKYKDDPARLNTEVAAAYRAVGTSTFAGFGASLLQLPVLSTIYRVVVVPTVGGHANAVLTASLWGFPLSTHWPAVLSSAGVLSAPGVGFVGLLALLVALAWVSSRQAAARALEAGAGGDAPGAAVAARLSRLLPYGTVAFALLAPLLVGVYLVVTTAWSVGERALLPRFA